MSNQANSLIYKPERPRPNLDTVLLIASGIGTGLMAGMAMLALLPETGMGAWSKSLLIAVLAGGVAYAVNRFAIERGAPLAATGYLTAGLMSVGSILFIGAGLFASTYAGMTLGSVAELQLHDHGRRLDEYAASQMRDITRATRAIPVIQVIGDDLRAKASCEISNSCISGNGAGGRGPIARALELIAGRADGIVQQLAASESQRQDLQNRIGQQLAAYQKALGETDISLAKRRRKLIAIDGEIDQAIAALRETVPLSLLASYAGELKQGIAMEGAVGSRINALLAGHGRALGDVLETLEDSKAAAPDFPAKAGVSSTFDYILHFIPIAAITAVIELILPLALWVYTFIAFVWEKEQIKAFRNKRAAVHLAQADASSGSAAKGRGHKSRPQPNGKAAPFDPSENDLEEYFAAAGRSFREDA